MLSSTSPSAEPIFLGETLRPLFARSGSDSSNWTMRQLSIPAMYLETRNIIVQPRLDYQEFLSKASTHTKEVYSQNPLTASEVIEMANSRVLTLAATVRPDGRPHLSPTDFVAVDGIFYLGVDEATARYRNLKQNPAVTVMLADDRKRQAILEGDAKC